MRADLFPTGNLPLSPHSWDMIPAYCSLGDVRPFRDDHCSAYATPLAIILCSQLMMFALRIASEKRYRRHDNPMAQVHIADIDGCEEFGLFGGSHGKINRLSTQPITGLLVGPT
jgi:hypothetical protein